MKKTIILTLVLVQSLLTAFAGEPYFLLSLSSSTMARVGIINDLDEAAVLILTNEKGKVVYEEEIESGKHFFKFLNLSSLPDGNYYFKLKNTDTLLQKALVIRNSEAQIIDLETKQPDVSLEEGKFLISYHNKSKKIIKLMVVHESDILFEKYLEEKLIHHKLDVSQYPVEKCTVWVKSDAGTFKYPLSQF